MFQGTGVTVVIRSLFSWLGIEPTTNYLLRKQYLNTLILINFTLDF